jgi:hypothetical protein
VIIALIVAIVVGLCASVATYRLVDHHPRPHAAAQSDSDVGLTP